MRRWLLPLVSLVASLVAVGLILAGCTASSATQTPARVTHSTPSVTASPTPDSDPLAGRTNPAVTPDTIRTTICTRGYTATVRPPEPVTEAVKRRMARQQGVPLSSVILDHLVPLEGGGNPGSATDTRNFLLQTRADSYVKDRLERVMHDDICSGRVPLRTAQLAMARDWRDYKQEVGDR